MSTCYSPRLVFLVLAFFSLIISPVVGLALPIFYVQTFVYDSSTIILHPDGLNYRIAIAACVILFIGFMMPVIKQNKIAYSVMALFTAVGLFAFYLSVISYTYIGKEQVVSTEFFEEKVFPWSEMKEVRLEYYMDEYGTNEEYLFTSTDGESIRVLLVEKLLLEDKMAIYRVAQQHSVPFVEQEKK